MATTETASSLLMVEAICRHRSDSQTSTHSPATRGSIPPHAHQQKPAVHFRDSARLPRFRPPCGDGTSSVPAPAAVPHHPPGVFRQKDESGQAVSSGENRRPPVLRRFLRKIHRVSVARKRHYTGNTRSYSGYPSFHMTDTSNDWRPFQSRFRKESHLRRKLPVPTGISPAPAAVSTRLHPIYRSEFRHCLQRKESLPASPAADWNCNGLPFLFPSPY